MKVPFKSNPLINKQLLLEDIKKDEYHSNKTKQHKEFGITPSTKVSFKNSKKSSVGKNKPITVSKTKSDSHFKTAKINESQPPTVIDKKKSENRLRNQKQSSLILKEQTDIVTTNFTESGRDDCQPELYETEMNEIDKRNYATNRKQVDISNHAETENILSHIDKLRFLFKSIEVDMAKLMKSEDNKKQLNLLNNMLDSVNPSNLYNDTKVNVINSNMLNSEIMEHGKVKDIITTKKEKVSNEIYKKSDMRIKKYGILFDFINTNLKEINDIMCHRLHDTNLHKIEEVQSNKLSSLHSRINLHSYTNIHKDNIYDYEDSEMLDEFPAITTKEKQKEINPVSKNNDLTKSILASSINTELYQDFLDCSFPFMQSFLNTNNMSKVTKKYELEKHFDLDQTKVLYKRSIIQIEQTYIDSEENIESDCDKTEEYIQLGVLSKEPMNDKLIKDIENKVIYLLFRLLI
jgi:hypothetical protein